jgi:hypothetical protein
MRIVKSTLRGALGAFALSLLLMPAATRAEEGASGHYMPGGSASFIDGLPSRPGIAYADFLLYYGGDASRPLPFAGLVTAGIEAASWANTVILLYRPDLEVAGGYLSFGAAIPYVWMSVEGQVRVDLPGRGIVLQRRSDDAQGLGDVTLYPFMIGWKALGGDLKYDFRLGVFAPTGSFEAGELANLGKNFWTVEPMFTASYLGSKNGLELSAYLGFDFNTENPDTHYRSGEVFHLDATAAQHLPLAGGVAGVGLTGFWYEQINDDSGPGSRLLGGFRSRTMGLGATLSYIHKIHDADVATELKWVPESNVRHRMKGDVYWFKLGLQF